MGLTKRALFPKQYRLFDCLMEEVFAELPVVISKGEEFYFDKKLWRLISVSKPHRYISLNRSEVKRYTELTGEANVEKNN